MSEHLNLGRIIERPQTRDAVHIAVAPVEAGTKLAPGQSIKLDKKGSTVAVGSANLWDRLGVVDPYLGRSVEPGEKFWMFLTPGSIKSIRHYWTHPSFQDNDILDSPIKTEAAKVIEYWADEAGLSYEEILDGAKRYLQTGDYLCEGGRWEGFDVGDNFWDAYEEVTGEKVPERDRGGFFSCSCVDT
jgi:hypothetical protein